MVSTTFASFLVTWVAFAGAGPLRPRVVDSLNQEATAEAHERDAGATRAFSDVQIKTSDGKCLFVDELSGDFRANLTPIEIADCGSTDGQGWDVITAGEHIEGNNVALIVSTKTQACFNFDPRRAAGNQVLLFSCGGRADGGGDVTNSQLFAFNGGAGPLSLQPQNENGQFCLTAKGNAIDIATCNDGDNSQSFTFGDAATGGGAGNGGNNNNNNNNNNGGGAGNGNGNGDGGRASSSGNAISTSASDCTKITQTVTVTVAPEVTTAPPANNAPDAAAPTTTAAPNAGNGNNNNNNGGNGNNNNNGGGNGAVPAGVLTVNPTEAVPVSRAGGTLQPTAAAESHQRDEGATRAFSDVSIRAPNGQCLFIDPTAGDFRQNLIPVQFVPCTGAPNEKFDVITQGKHNNSPQNEPAALIVSSLTGGCIGFDGRRPANDQVILFSCGGRADGEGQTDGAQLFPFLGQNSFALAPKNERGNTCILPGNEGRLIGGACPTDGSELFSVVQ
ncbi:hypothetical protein QBC38DRAFT_520305 [Podospora fimiseda]|uniref:Ricin B lectin domain-containing protein n=1 Tax=Podospora fimiseda TaxID=252190 RepID=A0AAN7BDU2_9PEZI|nr:hypothetical protein QBC38DRAFT_520305 [Podospora fimiseda]